MHKISGIVYIERQCQLVISTTIPVGSGGKDRVSFGALVGDLGNAQEALLALGIDPDEHEIEILGEGNEISIDVDR